MKAKRTTFPKLALAFCLLLIVFLMSGFTTEVEKLYPMTTIGGFEERYANKYELVETVEFDLSRETPSAYYEILSGEDFVLSFVDNGPIICSITIENEDGSKTYKCGFSGEGAVRIDLSPNSSCKVEYQLGLKEYDDPTIRTDETVDASSGIMNVYMPK